MAKKLSFAFITCASLMLSSCSVFAPKVYKAELNSNSESLQIGETKQLKIEKVSFGSRTFSSNEYSYVWTSSDSDIACVSPSGLVTAYEIGDCSISANITILSNEEKLVASCNFSITDPEPVKVTLNKTSANVKQGRSLLLSAVVEHAVNKNVTWNSTLNTISVNKDGLVTASSGAMIGATAVIRATSVANPKAFSECTVTVIEPIGTDYDYTIMLYMCGSTLENDPNLKQTTSSNPGLFSEDIIEILDLNIPDNFKVVIETGGTTKWGLDSSYIDGTTKISNSRLQRWEVLNHKLKLIETLSTNQMANQANFENFLTWGITNYDSTQMGLIMSGHGGGIEGCLFDDNYKFNYGDSSYSHSLNLPEIAGGVKNVLTKINHDKLTWIGFDCCLMQSADYASILGDYFEYMVASQENEFGEGWDHDSYMKLIIDDINVKPEVLLPKIAESFVTSGHEKYCKDDDHCNQTMSVLNLNKVNDFVREFNSFVSQTGTSSVSYEKYKKAFNNSYNNFGNGYYGLVDFKSYITQLSYQFPSISTASLVGALNSLVLSNNYCSRYTFTPCGLNAFLPVVVGGSKKQLQPSREDYSGTLATKFTSYQAMCLAQGDFSW